MVRLSSCKRATLRSISGEITPDLTMSEGRSIVNEEGSVCVFISVADWVTALDIIDCLRSRDIPQCVFTHTLGPRKTFEGKKQGPLISDLFHLLMFNDLHILFFMLERWSF